MVRSNRKSIPPTRGDGSPGTPSVAIEIINQQRREQADRAPIRMAKGTGRFVVPNTCEKDHTENELEFMRSMERYTQSSGRKFPTWSEVLEVLTSLGYHKTVPDNG